MELARSFVGLGRLDSARKCFAAAKRIDPRQAEAYVQEGYTDYAAGRADRAESDLRGLIAVDTSNPLGYHHLGSILAFEGRDVEAETYFRKSLGLFGTRPQADEGNKLHTLAWLGDIDYFFKGKSKEAEAEAYYQRGLREASSSNLYKVKFLMSLGWIYDERGKYAAAEDFYRRSTAVCADARDCGSYAPQAFMTLANFESERGRKREAHDDADRAWALLESESLPSMIRGATLEGFTRLGDIYWGTGDWAGAVKSYGRLLPLRRMAPNSPALAGAESGLAGVYAAQGRRAQAARLYRHAAGIWLKAGDAVKGQEARGKAAALDERGLIVPRDFNNVKR
jgi:tetratricopeptide (TPR) repeat protein